MMKHLCEIQLHPNVSKNFKIYKEFMHRFEYNFAIGGESASPGIYFGWSGFGPAPVHTFSYCFNNMAPNASKPMAINNRKF